jgi:hypothetical protein
VAATAAKTGRRPPGGAAGGKGWTWTTRPGCRASPAGRRRRCRRPPPSRQAGTGARCSTLRRPDPPPQRQQPRPPLSPPLSNRLALLSSRDPAKLAQLRNGSWIRRRLPTSLAAAACSRPVDLLAPPRAASLAHCDSQAGEEQKQSSEEERRQGWRGALLPASAPYFSATLACFLFVLLRLRLRRGTWGWGCGRISVSVRAGPMLCSAQLALMATDPLPNHV